MVVTTRQTFNLERTLPSLWDEGSMAEKDVKVWTASEERGSLFFSKEPITGLYHRTERLPEHVEG